MENKKFRVKLCASCGQDKKHHRWKQQGFKFTDSCDMWAKDDGMWIFIKKSGSWGQINYVNSACSGGVFEQMWAMEEGLA